MNKSEEVLKPSSKKRKKEEETDEEIAATPSVNVNLINQAGDSPLLIALKNRDLNMALLLLQHGANVGLEISPSDVKRKKARGRTVIHVMSSVMTALDVKKNFVLDCLELLWKFNGGAFVNVQDSKGRTPLYCFCKANLINGVQFLLNANSDITIPDDESILPFELLDDLEALKDKKLIPKYQIMVEEALTRFKTLSPQRKKRKT